MFIICNINNYNKDSVLSFLQKIDAKVNGGDLISTVYCDADIAVFDLSKEGYFGWIPEGNKWGLWYMDYDESKCYDCIRVSADNLSLNSIVAEEQKQIKIIINGGVY